MFKKIMFAAGTVAILLTAVVLMLPEPPAQQKSAAASQEFELGRGTNLAHWLSQTKREGAERRAFLREKDIAFIAAQGFQHVRLPIDEKEMWFEDGTRDEDAFATMADAIDWSLKHGLNVVVDLHILRSHYFNAAEKPLWTDTREQDKFIALWQDLSAALIDYPTTRVAYELMNEPVADDPDDWNRLVARAFKAVRALEPQRKIVIGSNRWQAAHTFDELKVPDDDNIILSFHFYEPFLMSHYQARWTPVKDYKGPIHYPGILVTQAEFDALPDNEKAIAKDWVGREFNKEILLKMMEKPLRKARELGLPLYCGEYSIMDTAPEADRLRWFDDMTDIFAEHDIGSANWNYKSDNFGFIMEDGTVNDAMLQKLTEK